MNEKKDVIAEAVKLSKSDLTLIEREMTGCFKFFDECTPRDGAGCGLSADVFPIDRNAASIASSGFFLAAAVAAVENGFYARKVAEEFCYNSLRALKNLPRSKGFYFHFYDFKTGARIWNSELSTIDTALFVAGAVAAGEYFGGRVKDAAMDIYREMDFSFFADNKNTVFHMAWNEKNGHYAKWEAYAEQLILYALAAGAPEKKFRVGGEFYRNMRKDVGSYGKYKFIYTWCGSLFVHQYSHAFIDFRGKKDAAGTDWFANSVTASLAARQFCIDNAGKHKGYGADSWGLSAGAHENGYTGAMGTPPTGKNDTQHLSDGTVVPYAALASVVFTPEESLSALRRYSADPTLTGEYGLYAAFNKDTNWVGKKYIGIDKGVTVLMLANFLNNCVWKAFGKSECVRRGLDEMGIK